MVHEVFAELSLHLGLAQTKTNDAIRRNELSRLRTGVSEADVPVYLTPRAKRALELAGEEANVAASLHVGTEHLISGRIEHGDTIRVDVDSNGHLLQTHRTHYGAYPLSPPTPTPVSPCPSKPA